MEHLIEDKNRHIKELGHKLKLLGGERTVSEPLPHPPGVARRTSSIAVQTSEELEAETQALDEPNGKLESTVVSSEDTVSVMMALSSCKGIEVEIYSLKQ